MGCAAKSASLTNFLDQPATLRPPASLREALRARRSDAGGEFVKGSGSGILRLSHDVETVRRQRRCSGLLTDPNVRPTQTIANIARFHAVFADNRTAAETVFVPRSIPSETASRSDRTT